MEHESCASCGGDGRIANSFGSLTACPSCRGSGRRVPDEPTFRDVTKTKPEHHVARTKNGTVAKATWPSTPEGGQLATQVQESTICNAETKTRLVREIIEHETTHGRCTQTFVRKIRKQVLARPA